MWHLSNRNHFGHSEWRKARDVWSALILGTNEKSLRIFLFSVCNRVIKLTSLIGDIMKFIQTSDRTLNLPLTSKWHNLQSTQMARHA